MIERTLPTAAAAAALGLGSGLVEGNHLHGTYHAVCRGFAEGREREYTGVFEWLKTARGQRDSALRNLARNVTQAAREQLRHLLQGIEDAERYLASLSEIRWTAEAPNVVTTVGANLALDTVLNGSSYSTTGPYMGLIGAVSYTGTPVIGDTMSSHSTWTEAGGTNAPTYSGNRPTVSFTTAASSKTKVPTTAPVFSITGTGTAKGVFLVLGSGAVATKDNTSGTLYSAGLFTGGDQAVVNTNTLTVTYTAGM